MMTELVCAAPRGVFLFVDTVIIRRIVEGKKVLSMRGLVAVMMMVAQVGWAEGVCYAYRFGCYPGVNTMNMDIINYVCSPDAREASQVSATVPYGLKPVYVSKTAVVSVDKCELKGRTFTVKVHTKASPCNEIHPMVDVTDMDGTKLAKNLAIRASCYGGHDLQNLRFSAWDSKEKVKARGVFKWDNWPHQDQEGGWAFIGEPKKSYIWTIQTLDDADLEKWMYNEWEVKYYGKQKHTN